MKTPDLLRLLFPPKCLFCGALLPRDTEEVCERCRRTVLLDCRPPRTEKGAFWAAAVAALPYEGAVRRTIQRFKYSGRQSYARPLARLMAYALETRLNEPYDLITFVPTSAHNVRTRGYDQAELLARELAGFTGKPEAALLRRVRRTRPMFGLRPAERRANVLGAFALCCAPEEIRGRTVLIADDVLTTGATLSECARVLRENGAQRVLGVAAASPKNVKTN